MNTKVEMSSYLGVEEISLSKLKSSVVLLGRYNVFSSDRGPQLFIWPTAERYWPPPQDSGLCKLQR